MADLHFFDRSQDVYVFERRLPHWVQPGVVCFVTWRTADSLPKKIVEACVRDRDALICQYGIGPGPQWRTGIERLNPIVRARLTWRILERWETSLDECHGQCLLRRPEISKIVAESLSHFDGEKYELTDFVVMPNHVHVLAAFPQVEGMLKQVAEWKRYQARQINGVLGLSDHFWQEDGFDHLVRSPEQFDYYRRYIRDNPQVARLQPGEYVHHSKQL